MTALLVQALRILDPAVIDVPTRLIRFDLSLAKIVAVRPTTSSVVRGPEVDGVADR